MVAGMGFFPPSLLRELYQVIPMIEAAPWLFVLLVIACLMLAWGALHLFHRRAFNNKNTEISHKNAEITAKNSHIAFVEKQRDEADKKLAAITAELAQAKSNVGTSPVAAEKVIVPTVTLAGRLHTSRVVTDTPDLESEPLLTLSIMAFNGSNETLRLEGLRGVVRLATAGGDNALPPAALKPVPGSAGFDAIPAGEFAIQIEQRLPRLVAASVAQELTEGSSVQLLLSGLEVWCSPASAGPTRERLELWDGVEISVREGEIVTKRVHQLSASSNAGARDHL